MISISKRYFWWPILSGLVAASVLAQLAPMTVRIGSSILRSNAIEAPLPEYPQQSLRDGREGSVSAKILVETDGSVSTIEVLEASDAAMGSSVQTQLKHWRFKPLTTSANERIRVTSRLVFHFAIRDGKPVVIEAAMRPRPHNS
jgi:TonB family protein